MRDHTAATDGCAAGLQPAVSPSGTCRVPPAETRRRRSSAPGWGAPATTSREQPAAQLADQPVATRTGAFSPARLVYITGTALSLFMALFAYLDDNRTNLAIFGVLAIVFFVLLVRSGLRRQDST